MKSKSELRTLLLQRRRAISVEERQASAKKAADLLAETPLFQQSQHIACYLACADEFDCTAIIQKIWQENKNCYVPVLSAKHPKTLEFAALYPDTPMKQNNLKILEPEGTHHIEPDQLDLIVMPLVGFDLQQHRLGMGGGFYDRTLCVLSTPRRAVLIGVAFEAQRVDTLPSDAWDVAMDGVLTEDKIYFLKI